MKSLRAETSYNLEPRVRKIYYCKYKMPF